MGVSVAFTTAALSITPTLESIDDFVIDIQTERGRPDEFAKTEAGRATFRLQDRLGNFDPSNPSGAHYGFVLPMRQLKFDFVNPITGGPAKDIFTGFTSEWHYDRIGPRGAETLLDSYDGFGVLQRAHGTFGIYDSAGAFAAANHGIYYAVQHVDDRIRAAAADAGWPSAWTRIATGNVQSQARDYDSGTSSLEIMQESADSEFPGVANLFMDKSGNLAFSGRGIRFAPATYPDWITTWRFGDDAAVAIDPTLLPIADLKLSIGETNLYNDVICSPAGVKYADIASNHVVDATSIGNFGRRSLTIPDLLVYFGTTSGNTAIEECRVYSTYYRNNYKTPAIHVDTFEIHGQMDDGQTAPGGAAGSLWDCILNIEVNHIVEISTVHPGGGGLSTLPFFVEGISNTVSRLNDKIPRWVMTLNLSPKALYASYP